MIKPSAFLGITTFFFYEKWYWNLFTLRTLLFLYDTEIRTFSQSICQQFDHTKYIINISSEYFAAMPLPSWII